MFKRVVLDKILQPITNLQLPITNYRLAAVPLRLETTMMTPILLLIAVLVAVLIAPRLLNSYKKPNGFAWNSPKWAENAVIYEVSVRHFSEAGTIAGVTEQLPRLKHLGVDIMWLMPIFPISKERGKGSLGSPYAVADYTAVNPDLGTLEDLRELVKAAHRLGIYVILDWVPNHTGWDHAWITEHKDWYQQRDGQIIDPIEPATGLPWGWTDVAALDYGNQAVHTAMIACMRYWLEAADIDGFRCDVAGPVPVSFWKKARKALNQPKELFMLSEWEEVAEHFDVCFEANYAWRFHKLQRSLVSGEKKAADFVDYLAADRAKFAPQGYHMIFTTNHDENAWNGTEQEMYGEALNTFTALCFTWEGMPLIFNGQEAGLNKRLAFFEPDKIDWSDMSHAEFLRHLAALHKSHPALRHGLAGGAVQILPVGDRRVLAFSRSVGDEHFVGVFNFCADQVLLSGFEMPHPKRRWKDGLTGAKQEINNRSTLKPWEFRLLIAD
jgi:alpha-amylase